MQKLLTRGCVYGIILKPHLRGKEDELWLHLKSETLKREEMLMKHAIIVTGGKQYRVAEGDVIFVEKLDVAAGEAVKFDQVLAVIDGETAVFGAPVIEGASVSANVVKSGKSAKIRVYKMKPKKGYRRTQGHRQPYTKVQIETINA